MAVSADLRRRGGSRARLVAAMLILAALAGAWLPAAAHAGLVLSASSPFPQAGHRLTVRLRAVGYEQRCRLQATRRGARAAHSKWVRATRTTLRWSWRIPARSRPGE